MVAMTAALIRGKARVQVCAKLTACIASVRIGSSLAARAPSCSSLLPPSRSSTGLSSGSIPQLLPPSHPTPQNPPARRSQALDEVRNLNLWGQDIDDCAILASLPGVEVLSLSVNTIPSLRDFAVRAPPPRLWTRGGGQPSSRTGLPGAGL
jgi:hypothetical protein